MKKKFMLICLGAIGSFIGSCEGEETSGGTETRVEITDYSVQEVTSSTGETQYKVTFNLEENADYVALYSGEFGHDYNFRNGRVVTMDNFNYSFTSNCSYGEQDPNTQLSVMLSTNFNGNYQLDDIHNATWTDVSDLFTLAPLNPGDAEYYPSGNADLGEFLESHQYAYLAFRYITPNQLENGIYAAVRIRDWTMNGTSDLGPTTYSPEWQIVESDNLLSNRNFISTSEPYTITLRGNYGSDPAFIGVETEAWVVTNKLEIRDVDLGPDQLIPVKAIGDLPVTSFVHTYSEPGNYEAVFVASKVGSENEVLAIVTVTVP